MKMNSDTGLRPLWSETLDSTKLFKLCVTTRHSADESRAVFYCFDKIFEHDMEKIDSLTK